MKHKMVCGIGAVLVLAFTAGVSFGQFQTPFAENFDEMDPEKKVAEQSAWETWFEVPGVDAYLVDDPVRSKPLAVEIGHDPMIDTDLIARFTDEFGKGCYDLTAHWWVSGDVGGLDGTYFIIQSIYEHNGNVVWAVQCHAAPAIRDTVICDFGAGEIPFEAEKWVEVKVRVNWDNAPPEDWHQVYFDGEPVFFEPISWRDAMNGGNAPRVASLDLYARETCCAYYDDITFNEDPKGCVGMPSCNYTVKKNTKPKKKCPGEACPKKNEIFKSEKACADIEDCAKKLKIKKLPCPDPKAPEKAFCKKLKGLRKDCS